MHRFHLPPSQCSGTTLQLEDREAHHAAQVLRLQKGARLTLLQAIPKGKTFEVIVQKATELGAHRVVPLVTERVVTRLEKDAEHKMGKWRQVAIESIKQCGSPWLPEISPPATLAQLFAQKEEYDLSLVAALTGDRQHPRRVFEQFQRERNQLPASIGIWVGPEGDFTADELAAILAQGAKPISLGANVLRAETAAIYCLSVLSYELQSHQT
jgi:16S rRNA (uracil1498-N3)-methyltransferase